MKNIALIVPYHYKMLSIAAILEVMETVNNILATQKKEEIFRGHIVQADALISGTDAVFQSYPVLPLSGGFEPDIILIPSFTTTDMRETLKLNAAYIPWLRQQYAAGAEIASFCTGAFLFAASGLLNGKLATTHVDACAKFVLAYPLVFVKPGRTLTADGRCYTSGGAISSFHLLIFLVQKYCGNELAVRIAKIFSIEPERHQQSYFSTFRPDHSHNDDMIKKVQKRIETGYTTMNTIDEVVKDIPASRRNILRRFKQVTGIPPIEYLQNIRIETAKKMLEQTDLSVAEIIPETGYADPRSFRKVFLKLVGITPLAYREKFKVK